MRHRIQAPNGSTATHALLDGRGRAVGWYRSREEARIAARTTEGWFDFSTVDLVNGGAEVEPVSAYSAVWFAVR